MNRSESGQLGFSVLLFQDLAVIPALALVPLLAGSADEHFDWMKIGMKVLAFVGMLIGGRYLLRPVFPFYCSFWRAEVFTAATLLLVLGSALFMDALGCRWRSVHLLRACCWRKVNIAMNWKRLSIPSKACCSVCSFYLCRHVAQPRGALYPSVVGSDKRGCAGGGENSRAVSAGAIVWRA